MNLNEQYAGACASWVRYSRYEFRQFPDGVRVMPAADAVPQLYNPLEVAWEMLAEAMELGRQRRQDLADIDEAVLRFAERYGLLGIAGGYPGNSRRPGGELQPCVLPGIRGTAELDQRLLRRAGASIQPSGQR